MWNGDPGSRTVVGSLERRRERRHLEVGAVARSVHVREVEDGSNPTGTARDLEHVVEGAEVADASHDLDSEGHGAVLALQPLAERAELLDDRVDRGFPWPLEKKTGVEDHDLRAARRGDAGAPVERADRRGELAAARLDMAHEAEERRVHGERDVVLAGELPEPFRERVVHPEAALEVDLARGVAPLDKDLDCGLRRLARGHPGRPDANSLGHGAMLVPMM